MVLNRLDRVMGSYGKSFLCFGKIVMSHTCWESVRGFPTSGMILTEKSRRQSEGNLLQDILIANIFPLR